MGERGPVRRQVAARRAACRLRQQRLLPRPLVKLDARPTIDAMAGRLCDCLGIEAPILQAPIGSASGPDLDSPGPVIAKLCGALRPLPLRNGRDIVNDEIQAESLTE